MANYSDLIQTINDSIKANGNQEITGPVLNAVLRAMVSALGAGYQYYGIAYPNNNPGTPDLRVFYIAWIPGTYPNFGGVVVPAGISIIRYSDGWAVSKVLTISDAKGNLETAVMSQKAITEGLKVLDEKTFEYGTINLSYGYTLEIDNKTRVRTPFLSNINKITTTNGIVALITCYDASYNFKFLPTRDFSNTINVDDTYKYIRVLFKKEDGGEMTIDEVRASVSIESWKELNEVKFEEFLNVLSENGYRIPISWLLEQGTVNVWTHIKTDSNIAVRLKSPVTGIVTIVAKSGYVIRGGISEEDYKEPLSDATNVFINSNASKPLIFIVKKEDGTEISVDEAANNINITYIDKVNLVGQGTKGSEGGVEAVGDIYYNPELGLRICMTLPEPTSGTYETVPFNDDATYILEGDEYYSRNGKLYKKNEVVANNRTRVGSPQIYRNSEILGHDSMLSYTFNELYAIYDDLVQNYPTWISRAADIGQDAAGNAIRQYIVRLHNPVLSYTETRAEPNYWSEVNDYDIILLSSGTHGDEKTSAHGLALAIKDLVESNDAWATYIKSNLIIKIIPCLNLWGYDNNSRNNYNGVNLNRDAIDFTQPESQAIKTWIDSNRDAILYLDVHNTSGKYQYFEFSSTSKHANEYIQLSAQIAAAMNSNWATIYNDDEASYPYLIAVKSSYTGMYVQYAEDTYGIKGFLTETTRDYATGAARPTNYLDNCVFTKDMVLNIIQSIK